MDKKWFWLAITLKDHVRSNKKPILLKISGEKIDEVIKDIKANSLKENYLFHIQAFANQVFFYAKDICTIKISSVNNKFEKYTGDKHFNNFSVEDDDWMKLGDDDE